MRAIDAKGLLVACAILGLGWLSRELGQARAADSLVWRAQENTLDAQVETSDLRQLMEQLAAATGWI